MRKYIIALFALCLAFACTGCGQNNESEQKVSNNEVVAVQSDGLQNTPKESENSEETANEEQVPEEKTEPKTEENLENSIKEEMNNDVVIPEENADGITVLKFKNTNSDEAIKALNGKQVSITGYLSTLSPLNGKFAYLMNMPYQSCPFCVPGTSAISNTLTIVAQNNKKIEFTDQPVTVVGTLETGNFTDEFGYQYGVRLNNVTVTKADIDKLSDTVKKYNVLAENGVVGDIYTSIMTVDASVFYKAYNQEKPQKITLDGIKATKTTLDSYNTNGDYDKLVNMMNRLIKLAETANANIEKEDYSQFTNYQNQLRSLYYIFARWMAEGEL